MAAAEKEQWAAATAAAAECIYLWRTLILMASQEIIKIDLVFCEQTDLLFKLKLRLHGTQEGLIMGRITRDDALALLKKYNKDPFHIQHALTVEAVLKWFANEMGYGDEAEYWGIVGLLHDIDFELYPDHHCLKAPELLREAGVSEDIIHSVVSHGYGITVGCGETIDVAPEHEMEKVLFAADELTGLIWAAALMRPSKSAKDMELKSLKKKYKSKGFAAGCSREVIERGANQLGWELDKLLEMTLQAMAATEDIVRQQMD